MLDGFTSSAILGVAVNDNTAGADLYKMFSKEEGGPSLEAQVWFTDNVGKTVTINGTDMEGIVKTLNTSTRGLYPGSRYPIYVEITKDDSIEYNAKGRRYEYDLDQLKIIP